MSTARPGPRRVRGVVVCLGLSTVLLTSCSGAVEIDSSSTPDGEAEAQCVALLEALPAELDDEPRREVSPDDALGAAWGDPAFVLQCAAPQSPDYDPFGACQEINGVGWFAPESQFSEASQAEDVTLTTLDREPRISILVPAEYRPDGVAAALAQLADPIKATIPVSKPCPGLPE